MLTLYARKEPTTCEITLAPPTSYRSIPKDVVLYKDVDCTARAGRYPWHYSKPTRRSKTVMHNCARYALVWLPDA